MNCCTRIADGVDNFIKNNESKRNKLVVIVFRSKYSERYFTKEYNIKEFFILPSLPINLPYESANLYNVS